MGTRRVAIASLVLGFLALTLIGVVFRNADVAPETHLLRKSSRQKASSSQAPLQPAQTPADRKSPEVIGNKIPAPAAPGLQEMFERHLAQLKHLADVEGLATDVLRREAAEAIKFIEEHKEELHDSLLEVCTERGFCDTLTTLLWIHLSESERDGLQKEACDKVYFRGPYEPMNLHEAQVLFGYVQNRELKPGIRLLALTSLVCSGREVIPAGSLLSLLRTTENARLRGELYRLVLMLGTSGNCADYQPILQEALSALENNSEARGTRMIILYTISSLLEKTPQDLRIDSDVRNLVTREINRNSPDLSMLHEAGMSLQNLHTIPDPALVTAARGWLNANRPIEVREAALGILLPRLGKSQIKDSVNRPFMVQSANIMLEVLHDEQDERFISRLLSALSRHPDPEITARLRSLAEERPDLREAIEKQLAPKKKPKISTPAKKKPGA